MQQAAPCTHHHAFDPGNRAAERSTRIVMLITLVAMVVEILAGWWFNSMALLADGWHMSSHAFAIGLSAFAYAAARRYAEDPRYAFGTWKIEVLAGFASAIFLLGVAAMMVVGSVERLFAPQVIQYMEAMGVAAAGLVVNLVCAFILGGTHEHGADHDHGHAHAHAHHHGEESHHHHAAEEGGSARHHDLNLRAAYVHVLADAATSVLAIVALAGGWVFGWWWLDPLMGIAGAVLVAIWAKNLLIETGKVLLDREMDHPVVQEIRDALETRATRITDLHVWRVGRRAYAAALGLVTSDPALTAAVVRQRLAAHEEIVHLTIEIEVRA